MKAIITTPEQSRATRHRKGVCFQCCDCKRVLPVQTSGGTGYACCDDNRHLVCYACADERQRADLAKVDRFTGYVSGDGRRLTTWSGGDLGSVSMGELHPWSRERRYLRAYDCHGQVWSGTGAPGMWCNLRKCKSV